MDNKVKLTVRIDKKLYRRLKANKEKIQVLVEQGLIWRLGQSTPGKK